MRESTIEKKVCSFAERMGWTVFPKFGQHSRGWPDRVFAKGVNGGLSVKFVEFKQRGQKLTRLQTYNAEVLRERGFEVYAIDNIEDGYKLFRERPAPLPTHYSEPYKKSA